MTTAKIMNKVQISHKVKASRLLGVVNGVLNEMSRTQTDIRGDVEALRESLGRIVRNELNEDETPDKILRDAEFALPMFTRGDT